MRENKKRFNPVKLNIRYNNASHNKKIKSSEWEEKLDAFLTKVEDGKEWQRTNSITDDIEPHINF